MISNDPFAVGVLLPTASEANGKLRGEFLPAERGTASKPLRAAAE